MPSTEHAGYKLPDAGVLKRSRADSRKGQQKAIERTAEALLQALSNFGVEAHLIGQVVGPRVTRYELQLAPGTKVRKVTSLKATSLPAATTELRILAPIPGKQAVGVEVPNRVVAGFTQWSRKNFRRSVSARLDAKPLAARSAGEPDCVPIFIIGMPRSGSTLVAEFLSRHAHVRYRGELAWLPFLAQQVAMAARPAVAILQKTASTYLAQIRQDDAPARFYIDKQPLNFLHLDLIAALFPNARMIHCERNERDTALSIWMQYFAGAGGKLRVRFRRHRCGDARLFAAGRERDQEEHGGDPHDPLRGTRDRCDSRMRELAAWLGLSGFDPEVGARCG